MSKKTVEEAKNALAKTADSVYEQNAQKARSLKIFEFVGATKAMSKLASSLSSQVLQALQTIQREEAYLEYGCKTWVEFLKEYPDLDLSKSQYYKLVNVLDGEGAEVFDLLNSLNIPLRQRQQLTSGTIAIDGNELVIGEQRVPVDDAKKVKRAIGQIAEQMERLEAKAQKAEKEVTKLKGRLEDAKAIAREAAASVPFNDNTDPANQAYMRVVASLTELTRALAEMDADEAEGRLASYRPGISQAVENCFTFSAAVSPTRRPNQPNNDTGLSNDDLADLMED